MAKSYMALSEKTYMNNNIAIAILFVKIVEKDFWENMLTLQPPKIYTATIAKYSTGKICKDNQN